MTALVAFAPMILGVAGGLVAMLLDAWRLRAASVAAALVGLSAGAFAAAGLALAPPASGVLGGGVLFELAIVACLVLGAIAIAGSVRTLLATPAGPRIAVLGAFAASAAAVVAVASDLGILFLSVEALALCGYGLVALADTDRAREAAMKWFVQGSVATALFIVGIGVIMSRTGGDLSYSALTVSSQGAAAAPLAIGAVLVLIALAFKSGAFPFHSWMPDAFETAPPAATAVLASAGKVGPLMAAVWIVVSVAGTGDARLPVVAAIVSVGSIVFGNLAALRQRSLPRMLAYSAIAQVGYAFAAIALASGAGSLSLCVFVVLYGLTSVASFLFIVAVREVEPGWNGAIAGLAGLGRRRPALAASLAVIMLSLTGIPLTAGFWGKFLVFGAAATGGYLWLAVVGMLGSVVSFGYYGRVLRVAFMDAPVSLPEVAVAEGEAPAGAHASAPVPAPASGTRLHSSFATVVTVVLAVSIVVIGLLPLVAGTGVLGR